MDRRAFLAAALSAAAGCGSGGDASRTVAPNLQGEPSPSPTPTPAPTATPTPAVEDRPRQVIAMNPTLHDIDLDLRVTEGDEVVSETACTRGNRRERDDGAGNRGRELTGDGT